MANSIKYTTGAETLALRKDNFYIGTGDVGKGPTSTSGYYNSITPPQNGYTIYLNKASGGPSIYVCSSDAELIALTNIIASQAYTQVSECLVYYREEPDKMCLSAEYEAVYTDGLVINLDAGFCASYPQSGSTWYDISPNLNNATVYNNPIFDNSVYGSFNMDGSNEYAAIPYNSTLDFSAAQTVMIWMKPGQGSQSNRRNPYNQAYGGSGTITHEPSGTFNYYFGTHGGNSQPYVGRGSGFTVLSDELAFITVTRDQSQDFCRWYKNGSLSTNSSAGGYPQTNNGNQPIWIGDGYTSNFIGNIYSVYVYNRSFTTEEVLTTYNLTKVRFGL